MREAIPELFTHFVLFLPRSILGQGFQSKVQGQQLLTSGNMQRYISTSFCILYNLLFSTEETRNCWILSVLPHKHSEEKEPKSFKTTLCPFIVMHMLLNATKSFLLLQLHRVTYLVNFQPKESQKSTSRLIPPLHFLGEMWIAITVLLQKKAI